MQTVGNALYSVAMSAVIQAVEFFGGQHNLAIALDVKPPTVHQWVKGIRPVPKMRCLQIEKKTHGQIRCEDLRPDIDWSKYLGDNRTAA